MRRHVVLGLTVVLVVGALLGTSRAQGHVQQTTPPAASGITGVKVETLGRGPSRAAPGNTLLLFRMTFAPGGKIALHRHPGDGVFYVDSGRITWTTGEGTPLLTRAAAAAAIAAGTPTPPEPLAAGQEVVLEPGDAVFYDGQTSHEVRNDGAEEAVVLYAGLRAADQPGITFLEVTPAPAADRPAAPRAGIIDDAV
jgi:quercetin dioxygenase-like cupin family protein